jgi:hypothetical protein
LKITATVVGISAFVEITPSIKTWSSISADFAQIRSDGVGRFLLATGKGDRSPFPPNRHFQNFSPSIPFVRFIAMSQGIDTDASNPASRLMLTILAGVAEFEREIIRERTVSGMKQARADGKILGRPARVFDRVQARKLRDSGSSWRSIARALGVPVSTVVDGIGTHEQLGKWCTEIVPSPIVTKRGKQRVDTPSV